MDQNLSSSALRKYPQLQQWHDKGSYVSLCDQKIFFIEAGSRDKPTILLIHGFPTSSWDWEQMWEPLLENYHLVCMDMLGFGFSSKPNNRNYTIHLQADIVEALIEHIELKDFHVLAHDYGDTVSQELLARQNDGSGKGNWLSCCFLNGGLFPETHRALLTQKLLLSPIGGFINKLSGKKQFDQAFSKVFGNDTKPTVKELDEFWTIINLREGKHLFHNLITYMRDRIQHRERWVNALQQSKVPLALINGSFDPVSGAHMVARYQELKCRLDYLAELKPIGHYPQVEDARAVTQHYLQFLSEHQKRASSN